MSKEDEYYKALMTCVIRYRDMAENDADLIEFLIEFEYAINCQLPLLKLNRWLGYVQGVLIERKRTTVEAERNYTRPLFRHLDFD